MIIAKDDQERSILAAAVESASADVVEAVMSATKERYLMEEVRYQTMPINL